MPGPGPEATDDEILKRFALTQWPVLGAGELAETFGIARQTMDRRLRQLEDEGLVASRIVGNSRVWWITPEGRSRVDVHSSGNQ